MEDRAPAWNGSAAMPFSVFPTLAGVGLLALMAASAVRAFAGEAPSRRWVPVAPAGVAAGVLLVLAYPVAHLAGPALGAIVVTASVEVSCLAGWCSRAPSGGGGGWDPPEDPPVDPPPPDWEEFERALRDLSDEPALARSSGRT